MAMQRHPDAEAIRENQPKSEKKSNERSNQSANYVLQHQRLICAFRPPECISRNRAAEVQLLKEHRSARSITLFFPRKKIVGTPFVWIAKCDPVSRESLGRRNQNGFLVFVRTRIGSPCWLQTISTARKRSAKKMDMLFDLSRSCCSIFDDLDDPIFFSSIERKRCDRRAEVVRRRRATEKRRNDFARGSKQSSFETKLAILAAISCANFVIKFRDGEGM